MSEKLFSYPMSKKDLNRLELGKYAKVLIDLYLEDPKKSSPEFVFEQLLRKYEGLKFDLED